MITADVQQKRRQYEGSTSGVQAVRMQYIRSAGSTSDGGRAVAGRSDATTRSQPNNLFGMAAPDGCQNLYNNTLITFQHTVSVLIQYGRTSIGGAQSGK